MPIDSEIAAGCNCSVNPGGITSAKTDDSGDLGTTLLKLGTNSIGSLFSGGSAAAGTLRLGSTGANDTTGLTTGISGGLYHSGGLVGFEPTSARLVDPAIFSRATRYHTGGLAGDEVPAILQRGEGVFTAGQMAAIGSAVAARSTVPSDLSTPANYNYNLTSTPGAGGASTGSTGGSGGGGVVVSLHNQTGTQQTAVASQPKFDDEKMVIDIVTKHANSPAPFRTAPRG